MAKELPPRINTELKTNGHDAVGAREASTGSHPEAAQQVSMTLMDGGVGAEAMWGPLGCPD